MRRAWYDVHARCVPQGRCNFPDGTTRTARPLAAVGLLPFLGSTENRTSV